MLESEPRNSIHICMPQSTCVNMVGGGNLNVGRYGVAVDLVVIDGSGQAWMGNGEYSNACNFCPFCGTKLVEVVIGYE